MSARITDIEEITSLVDSLMGCRAIISDTESYRPGLPTIYDSEVDEYILRGWDMVIAHDLGTVVVLSLSDDAYECGGSISMRSVTIIR